MAKKQGFALIHRIETYPERLEALVQTMVLIMSNRSEHQEKNKRAFRAVIEEWLIAAKDVLKESPKN